MSSFSGNITESVPMYWRSSGTYIGGAFIPNPVVSTKVIRASVQRLSMAERQRLPEGFRSSDSYKLYTQEPQIQVLINETLMDAAEFEYRGQRFAMLAWEEWDYLIAHWKITMVGKRG